MGPDQNDSGTQTDVRKDPRTGRFVKGHKPFIVKGNCNGKRGRPGKDYVQAWDWAKTQKPLVVKKLVEKAISGHHPSIELYLAYVALLLYEAEDPAYEAGGGSDYALVLAPSLVVHYCV